MPANAGAIFAGIGQDLVTGTVLSGLFGTTLPATSEAFFENLTLTGFNDCGYVGEPGVTLSTGRSFTDIKDMDGTILDTIQTEFNGTIKTNFLELNEFTLKNLFGPTNVTVTGATTLKGNRTATVICGEDLDPQSWIFRMKAGSRRVGIVVPKGRVTEQGDLAFTSSGAVSIDATIKTIPVFDVALSKAVDCYVITDDGVWALAGNPAITSILPTGRSVGGQVTITGVRFSGASAVSIDGVSVAAPDFSVVSDTKIVAVIPATAAGASDVIVTNGTGPSTAVNYTVT
jgi:hypothetical protein